MSSSVESQPERHHSVFVYGSLLADEVVGMVLNRVPHSSPATLHNFKRFSIKGRIYPAILPVEKTQVTGRVLLGVTDEELDALDAFENVDYERTFVNLSLFDTTDEKVKGWTYVWVNKTDPDLCGDWNFEVWEQEHKTEFLEMAGHFLEELARSESNPRVEKFCENNSLQQADDESTLCCPSG